MTPGDPMDYRTQSGVARRFVDALAEEVPVVARIDASMTNTQRAFAATINFHPLRDHWRRNMHASVTAARLCTQNLRRGVWKAPAGFDLVLHIRGSYTEIEFPFVSYIDNTSHLALQHWPGLVGSSRRRIELGSRREQRALGRAEHIFVTGHLVKRSLVDQYGIPEQRVTVVGGGVNFEPLPILAQELRPPVILFIGMDFARKGGYELLEAFRFVRQHIATATLRIAGAAPQISEPGVETLGIIRDRAALSGIYSGARVFCHPARYEPYGMVVLEAMAHGLPVVTTDVGAMDEILDGGRAGVLVPPSDPLRLRQALLELLGDDGTKAARIGAKARERVERELTWPRVVDRMVPALERLGRRAL